MKLIEYNVSGVGRKRHRIGAFMVHRRQESPDRYAAVAAEFLQVVLDYPRGSSRCTCPARLLGSGPAAREVPAGNYRL